MLARSQVKGEWLPRKVEQLAFRQRAGGRPNESVSENGRHGREKRAPRLPVSRGKSAGEWGFCLFDEERVMSRNT
jgi:hypothetical protein